MIDTKTQEALIKKYSFLNASGEMAALTRQKDWSSTSVGPIDNWPENLRISLGIILHSKFPMFIFWGDELTCFYNDAYRPSLGNDGKHPHILGMAGEKAWPDIWYIIKPLLNQVLQGGDATWSEDQLIPIYRNGKMEDVYWTFSYSPINEESGKVSGVFVTCTETTDKVLALKKIAANEQKFRNTVKQAPVGIAILKGKNFMVEMVNDAYLELIDKEEASFTGKPLFDSLPKVKEIVEPLLNQVLTTGVPYNATGLMVTLNRHGKNENAYFNLVYQPYKEIDGSISGVMVIANEVTASVKAQHNLTESERQFRNMVLQSPIPMAIFRGEDYVIEMANSEMINNIWRKKEADIIGKKLLDVFPELKHQKFPELLKEVLKTGKPHRENDALAYVQGDDALRRFYLDYEYSPLSEPDGKVSGIMVTVNDVTEKVETREKIKENEEKLRVAIDASRLGTFEINLITDEIAYSERYLEIYGFNVNDTPTRQEVINTLHPDDIPIRVYYYERALTSGILEYEAKVQLPNNFIRWIKVKGKVLYDINKNAVRILGTVMDISKEKNTLRLIEESEMRLRLAIEGTKLATWDLDLQTREIIYSNRLADIFGQHLSTVITHQVMRNQIIEQDRPIVEKAFEEAMTTGFYSYEARILRPDKTICWIKTQGNVIFDDKKRPIRLIGTLADITESKNDEDKVAKLAAIVQSSEDAIISKNLDGIITSWNDAAERIFGFTSAEMIGSSILKLIPEDRRDEEKEIIGKLKKGERITHFETKRLRKDKTSFDISLTVSPIKDKLGNIIGASKIARDITIQKQVEKIISENEHRLKIAVEAAEMGTWELNLLTDEVAYSNRYLEIFGFDAEHIPNHLEIMNCIHLDDIDIRDKAIEEALQTGVLDLEMRIIAGKSKALKWIKLKANVVYDHNNKPLKMMGTTLDITAQKTLFESLRINEERFRLLANAMPQLVWTSDTEGNLNYFNQSVYNFSGITEEQMEADGWLQIVHPDDREENIEKWMHAITTGEDFLLEHRFRKHDGQYRWQLSRAIPQKDKKGKIQMWVGTSTDINDIKESDQQKDLFISMASHELKTPITSIKGYVQILMSMYNAGGDDFLKNSLTIINKQIGTLTSLIGDLLDLSKIKSGSLQLSKEQFYMNAMIKDVINDIQHAEPSYKIIFTPDKESVLIADKERIGQVLINFLTNAIKYSPNCNTIHVHSTIENNYAVVSVSDKGIGINKLDQDKIFTRFYRVEGKNEKTFPGFGIGLFIAAEIIQRHEGKIQVKSEFGKGSVFTFLLPL